MKKRILSIMLASVLVVGLASGCGTKKGESTGSESNSGKTQLTVMINGGDPNWKKAVEETAKKFMEANDNAEIKIEKSGSGMYLDYLKTKQAVGEFGDVVEIKDPNAFSDSGILAQMPENISELVENPIQYNGKTYIVPTIRQTQGVIYNKKIFNELGIQEPETFQDFLNICEKIKESGVDPLLVCGGDLWHMAFWVNHFMRTDLTGKNPDWEKQRTDKKVSWTDADAVNMMSHIQELFDKGYVQDGFMSTADSQTPAILTSGTAAMCFTGPWMLPQIEEADPNFEAGWFFVPNDEGERYVFNDVGSGWSISENCKKDEAKYQVAQDFLEFYYSKDNYSEVLKATNTLPATKEDITYEATEVQEDLMKKFLSDDAIKSTVQLGDIDTPDGFRDFAYKTVQNLLMGEISQKEALESLDKEWDKCVEAQNQ